MKIDEYWKLYDRFDRSVTDGQSKIRSDDMEMKARFVQTYKECIYPGDQIEPHAHVFYEVVFCQYAQGVEYLAGTSRYCLQKGDIIVIPPKTSHRILFSEELTAPFHRICVWISPELMDGMVSGFDTLSGFDFGETLFLRTAGTKWESLDDLFHFVVLETERRELGWEAAVIGCTISLLVQLMRAKAEQGDEVRQTEKPELLDRIMSYIEDNLPGRISLGETARYFFVSESTISHVFKERLGVSFYRCVTQKRLAVAKILILSGHPLESVGRQVGFLDYSSFYRAFRQEFGLSPRQYRKLQQTEKR